MSEPQDEPAAPVTEARETTESSAAAPIDGGIGEELTLKVRRGDSLDRMFKRNKLSRADLASIMKLDDARKHLRLIKPGDEILVRHSEGNIQTLSKPVSLGERLAIQRIGDSFEAEMIERAKN